MRQRRARLRTGARWTWLCPVIGLSPCRACRGLLFFSSGGFSCRAQVGVDHAWSRPRGLAPAFQAHAAHFEHVAVVGHFERSACVLLHQQDRDARGAQRIDRCGRSPAPPAAPGPGWARRASAAWAATSARGPPPASAARRPTACPPVGRGAPSGAGTACRPRPIRSRHCLFAQPHLAECAEHQVVLHRTWWRTARAPRVPAQCPASRAPRGAAPRSCWPLKIDDALAQAARPSAR